MSSLFTLNQDLNASALAAKFARKNRVQIPNFFTNDTAQAIEAAMGDLDWQLVLRSNEKHVDVFPPQMRDMGAARLADIQAYAQSRGAHDFAYLYYNHPIADTVATGNLNNDILERVYQSMNDQAVLGFLKQVANLDADFCDMQATNYGPGHFLTRHDDGNPGKNRTFAYVYSLCQDWRAEWGGLLQFLDAAGNITDSFIPQYNTLSIFHVPQHHHVTQVSTFTPNPRLSLTGWFRTGSAG